MMDLHARQSYQPNIKPKRWLWFIRLGKKIRDRYAHLRQLAACHFKQSKCDPYEFLPAYLELMERPPARSARVTAMAISLLVLFALTWAYLGELAIHATATGRLILPSRAQTIQAYELSEVAAIFVQNGQAVKAGDQLLVLNTVGIREEMRRCQAQTSFQQLEVARYRALLTSALAIPADAKPSIKTSRYFTSAWQEHLAMLDKFEAEIKMNQAEQRVHQKRLAGLQKLKKNIEKRLSPSRRLAQSNFMAKMTLLEREKEVLENQSSITAEQETLKVLQARAHTLQAAKSSYSKQKYRKWHDQLHRAQSALSMAEQELAKAQARSRLQIVQAPMDGIVQQLAVHTIGGVVQGAQKLMILTPHDVPQQAEITIANKDIGFIQPGQPVTIKIEAFPYSRYGTINGTVQSISLDSIKPHESHPEFVFPAQIELAQNHMMIDDERVPLTPGMAVVAEIKIGKRRIIDYLLSPIREYKSQAWREP